jgi:hypothetical protein
MITENIKEDLFLCIKYLATNITLHLLANVAHPFRIILEHLLIIGHSLKLILDFAICTNLLHLYHYLLDLLLLSVLAHMTQAVFLVFGYLFGALSTSANILILIQKIHRAITMQQ